MSRLYEVELEPEVRSWLAGLADCDFAESTSWSVCSPSMRKNSANPTPATWAGRYESYGSICYASRRGSHTGWHLDDE